MRKKNEDQIFAKKMRIQDFKFDKKVASVFDDMLNRSVPFYRETQYMGLQLAVNFVKPKTRIYDIGCSTGNVLKGIADLVPDPSVQLVGIDNSPSMLDQTKKKLKGLEKKRNFRFDLKDISEDELNLENASVIFMNYTLQFVRPLHREFLVREIYTSLVKNGCFILIEKILGNDSLFNRLYIDLYYEFKREQGYSDKEINQKREALENILIPYRLDENIGLLKKSGFSTVDIFFKWYNFAGFIAVK